MSTRGSLRVALKESMKGGDPAGDRPADDRPRRGRGRPKKAETVNAADNHVEDRSAAYKAMMKDKLSKQAWERRSDMAKIAAADDRPRRGRGRPKKAKAASNPRAPSSPPARGGSKHAKAAGESHAPASKPHAPYSPPAAADIAAAAAVANMRHHPRAPAAGRKRPPEELMGYGAGEFTCTVCKKTKKNSAKAPGEAVCMTCAVQRFMPGVAAQGPEAKPPPKKKRKYRKSQGTPLRVKVSVKKASKDAEIGLGIGTNDAAAGGVRVNFVNPHGLFHGTYLEVGMVIESVNQKAVDGFDDCLAKLKEAEGKVTVIAHTPTGEEVPVAKSPDGASAVERRKDARAMFPSKDDDDLLPQDFRPGKCGRTPVGRLKSCMCPNPAKCRAIMFRWARLKDGKYIGYRKLPEAKTTKKPMPQAPGRAEHGRAYREAVLRSFGYPTDGSTITRTVRAGSQDATMDKAFSEQISLVHFHPDVVDWNLTEKANEKVLPCDKWRVPLDLGERIGLSEEDRCPSLNTKGEQTYFALPNYSLEKATADIEKAEDQYKQKVRDFQAQNKTLLSEMAANPEKYVMKVAELENQNAKLLAEVKELKEKQRKDLTEKHAMQKKHDRLERGLEKLARRMDKMETVDNIGGITNRDAKEIYKWSTGKDLSEEGIFGVSPTGGTEKLKKGERRKTWVDPRMDRAVKARWDNPLMSNEDALRKGGYDFPPLGKGVIEKRTLDSEGVSVTSRKADLMQRFGKLKRRMRKKAQKDPELAQELAEKFPEVEAPPEGVYAGLDLRGIPDQPLVYSKASKTGLRGVKLTEAKTYNVAIGNGEDGQKKILGTFPTLDEAGQTYAKAKFYLKENGYPADWATKPRKEEDDADDTDHNGSDDEKEAGETQYQAAAGYDHWC